jgi:hypothetical protein
MTDFHGEPAATLQTPHFTLDYLTLAPRIVRFAPAGKTNLLADLGLESLATPHGEFRFRGGHRLWHSPEAMPRTYMPDNEGAIVSETDSGIRIEQPADGWTHIAKSVEIVPGSGAKVTIRHSLRNEGAWDVELAPWALTMLRLGGIAIFPQPVGNVDTAGLLPNRGLSIWPYTHINDPRLTLGDDFLLIRAAPALPPIKLGYFNPHGWMAYWLEGTLFVKRFDPRPGSPFPDGGCNTETYCNHQFIELETLGPLQKLPPGAETTHIETWELYDSLDQPFIPETLRKLLLQG